MTDLRKALELIKRRAFSDAQAEESEDAQSDLRDIYVIADAALAVPPTPDFAAGYAAGIEALRAGPVEKVENDGGLDLSDAVVLDWIDCIARALPVPASPWRATQAAQDVIAERRRQTEVEGWTAEHDDSHTHGEMAGAAACYALTAADYWASADAAIRSVWPWDWKWWKRKDRRRNLVKAAALLFAEIEQLDRLPSPPTGGAT